MSRDDVCENSPQNDFFEDGYLKLCFMILLKVFLLRKLSLIIKVQKNCKCSFT